MEKTSLTYVDYLLKKIKIWMGSSGWSALIACLAAGIIAHGFIIFNKISFQDDLYYMYGLGATYSSGRWFLGIVEDMMRHFGGLYSVPVFNGFLSLFIVAVAAVLVVRIFEIKNCIIAVYIGAIMVAFPVITSTFAYMYTAPMYMMSLLYSILAAYLVIKKKSIITSVVSACLLTCSIGIYQAYFPVALVIFLIHMIYDAIKGKYKKLVDEIKDGFIYLGTVGGGIVLWRLMLKLLLAFKHWRHGGGYVLTGYQGMNESYDISMLPSKIKLAYEKFFDFRGNTLFGASFQRNMVLAVVILSTVILLVLIFSFIKDYKIIILNILLMILLPFCINIVFALSTSSDYFVRTLMEYPNVFILIIPVTLISVLDQTKFKRKIIVAIGNITTFICLLCCFLELFFLIYFDNAAYLNLYFNFEYAKSYYTEMIADIRDTENYTDETEVIFVGITNLEDKTRSNFNYRSSSYLWDSFHVDIVNDADPVLFMRINLGFGNDNIKADDGTYSEMPKVQGMPVYPDYGSVRVIDGAVIVKIGNT